MIIAIADLHLGDPASNKTSFLSFIEGFLKPNSNEITDLVLLGDILDLWRRNSSSIILENINILNDIGSLGFHVHYLVGNHDFMIKEYGSRTNRISAPEGLTVDPQNLTVGTNRLLTSGGEKYRFMHGHQMNYWYSLPFYEAFSRAMCDVNEDIDELANVWSILRKYTEGLSPFVSEKIERISVEKQKQIDRKLAGPLIGNSTSMQESIVEDYQLLREFTEFRHIELDRIQRIYEEILALANESTNIPNIMSLVKLAENNTDISFEELASNFLSLWIDTFRWMCSETKMVEKKELARIIRRIQRVAAMFSTNLQHDEFLIHGHGHYSYVDYTNRMADSGCWIDGQASFIRIEEGSISCSPWPIR